MPLTDRFLVQDVAHAGVFNRIMGTGDFNGDGRADLVLGFSVPTLRTELPLNIALSRADGTYELKALPQTVQWPFAAVGDFNNDGKLDISLFDGGYYDNSASKGFGKPPKLLLGDGTGSFTSSTALADAVLAYPGGRLGLKPSDADLHVKDVAAADIDGDGDLDIWVESTGGDNIVNHFMINRGDGTFIVDESRISRATVFGEGLGDFFRYGRGELLDLNGDGRPDLVLGQIRDNHPTHINQSSYVIYNDGAGNFPHSARVALPTPDFYFGYTAVTGIAAGDMNGDGRRDLVVVHTRNDGVSGPGVEAAFRGRYVQVLIGQPDGSFVDETAARMGDQSSARNPKSDIFNTPTQTELVDLDKDGDLDLLLGGNGSYWQPGSTYAFMNNGHGVFSAYDGAFYTEGQTFYGGGGVFIDLNGDGRSDFFHIRINVGPNGIWEGNSYPSDDNSTLIFQTATTALVTAQTAATLAVNGIAAAETLTGTAANERFFLGAGDDRAFGQAGDDALEGGAGRDYLRGDEGDDFLSGGDEFDDLHGNMGNDTVVGGAGDDWVVGGRDNDLQFGGDGFDVVYGNLGSDTLNGDAGNDWIRGGQQADVLNGGPGDDWMSGDRDNDTLTGGLGADLFNLFAGAGADRITDFSLADGDRIRWEGGLPSYTLTQSGADTLITYGADQVVLVGVQATSLTGTSWFVLA